MNLQLSDPNFVLLLLGIIAIIVELMLGVATGFDLFLIGIMFIIGSAIGTALHSFPTALIVVVVLSLMYVTLGRKLLKDKLAIETKSTNVEAVIGKKAEVVKKISSKKPGQIKIEGEVWRADAKEDIDVGETVVIQSVSGVTLQVRHI